MKKYNAGEQPAIRKLLVSNSVTSQDREQNDYYATDPRAIDLLLDEGKIELSDKLWEPACGEGYLSKRLEERGYKVYSTDLIDRGYGEGNRDFLSVKKENAWDGDIITNPPYKFAKQFIEKGLQVVKPGHKVVMFLKLQFLEGKERRNLFNKRQLRTVYVSSSRIPCAKNGDFDGLRESGGSAVAYAWYEFQKGYDGDPTIKWIN